MEQQRAVVGGRFWGLLGVFRAPRLAAAIPPILVASLGVLLAEGGLGLIKGVLPFASELSASLEPSDRWDLGSNRLQIPIETAFGFVVRPAIAPITPFLVFFTPKNDWSQRLSAGLAGFWLILIWQIIGAALARCILVRVATGSYLGIVPSLRFAVRRTLTLVATPWAPLLIVLALSIPGLIVGGVGLIPGVGPVVAPALGFIPLLFAILQTVILWGLGLGWPLIATTIAAEDDDGFDALSRTYSYVKHRLLPYVLILVLGAVAGVLGVFVAQLFVWNVHALAAWSAPGKSGDFPLWGWLSMLLFKGWIHASFWATASIAYLWLRQEVDGTDPQQIAIEEPTSAPPVFSDEPVAGSNPETPTS